ncbi:hypothetical protein A9Q84_07080 [Halobacteriovorax marinus]|uniref:ABC1 atypical kinase-like domain-containing protein n=1 Tax=Halobacteriovorax marinus TaxID=97084 RepID=A0A1Y5FAW6_9BACT|nr:hypothetical protein A9Q84_07080 [Halobacteriovorax marinus]
MIKNYVNLAKCLKSAKGATSKDSSKANSSLNELYDLFMQEKGLYLKLGQFLNQYKSDVNYSEKVIIKSDDIDINFKSIIAKVLEENNLETINDCYIMGSIGLVTQVKDSKGQLLALKIKYPNIDKNIDNQFKTLKNLLKVTPIPISKSNFDKDYFLANLYHNITNELNYKREYSNSLKIKEIAENNNFLTPAGYQEPTSNSVLISNWVDGINLGKNIEFDKASSEKIATSILSFFHDSLFNEGFIQVDNQEDNYIYSKTSQRVYMVDLGNCMHVTKEQRTAILRIIHSVQNNIDDNFLELLSKVGFDKKKLEHIEEFLAPLMYAILAPYVSNIKYDLKNYNIGSIVDNILGDKKWWFRLSGSPEFFSLMRSFSLVLKTLKSLNIQIFFRGNLKNIVSKNNQADALSLQVGKRDLAKYFQSKADNLNIRIIRNGDEKVNLTLPSTVLFELDSFLSPDTLKKIEKSGGDIKDVIRKAFQNQLMSGTLLNLKNGNEQFIITLN